MNSINHYSYNLKCFIKGFLNYKFGVSISKSLDDNRLKDLILLFKKNLHVTNLIRIGDDSDGGYLVPDVVSEIDVLFSPGVAETYSFEKSLFELYNIESFMIDASVDGPMNPDYNFEKLFLGSNTIGEFITLKDWLIKHNHLNTNKRKMLQMDIEGFEYEVLLSSDLSVLKCFDIMLIEFHFLTDFMNKFSFLSLEHIFNKILSEFYIVHIHPNNHDRVGRINNIFYPECLEFTFLRKDLCSKHEIGSFQSMPHILDIPNNKHNPEIKLSNIWSDFCKY